MLVLATPPIEQRLDALQPESRQLLIRHLNLLARTLAGIEDNAVDPRADREPVDSTWQAQNVKKQINVVGAVIIRDGLVLCTQRGSGALAGKWEFPGGKIEKGETPRAALEREIREELVCEVTLGDEVTTTTYEYDFGIVRLTTFYGELVSGEPQLTEHSDGRWLWPDELDSLDWAPADVPAVMKIRDGLAET